mmetsp:Transcript_28190/g.47226  ORF Transcript_28190/g.47226 Transcript_28190/m.47226 type:complete len:295 (-) Transcript_28190:54-938(-)
MPYTIYSIHYCARVDALIMGEGARTTEWFVPASSSYLLSNTYFYASLIILQQVLEDLSVVHKLLGNESGDGNHGKAAVVQLPGLLFLELRGIGRREAKGIKTEVTHLVLGQQLVHAGGVGTGPSDSHAVRLANADDDEERLPEAGLDLLELEDGGAGDGAVEEGEVLESLTDDEAERGKHGNAPVRELGLAVSAHVLYGGGRQETSGVEHVGEGGGDSGQGLAVGDGLILLGLGGLGGLALGLHDERLAGHGMGAHRAQGLGGAQRAEHGGGCSKGSHFEKMLLKIESESCWWL